MNFLQFFNIPGFIAAGLYYAFTHVLGTQQGTAVFTQAAPIIVPAIETSLAPHLGSAGASLTQAASGQTGGQAPAGSFTGTASSQTTGGSEPGNGTASQS